jgi:hypothetical protein
MAESTPSAPDDAEDRLVIPLDPAVAIGALLEVDPAQMPPEPCPKLDSMGKRCKAVGGKGHFGPCQYDA